MSLADELMADLESNEEDEEEQIIDSNYLKQHEAEDRESSNKMDFEMISTNSISDVARLIESERMLGVLNRISFYENSPPSLEGADDNPEYQLIVEANNLAADINNEIANIYKFSRDKYTERFPELETLVVEPLDYLMTAKELGNNLEKAKNNKILENFLSQATIMVVSVTASTTQGKCLSDECLEQVTKAADVALRLDGNKARIVSYVESRMEFMAPNLLQLVGATIAARLMGAAGGIDRMSKMPSNDICLLGQQKKTLSGFSQTSTLPHTGFIYYSSLVQNLPPDLRRKGARVLGAKCALAVRVDAARESPNGSVGADLMEEIHKKIDKWMEAAPFKQIRALPAPVEAPKKRRGGKRVRKLKERYATTELRKQANRMNFGELGEDLDQTDLSYDRGNIGKSGIGGRIRMAQIDERTKVRISQTLKKNLQKQAANATWGGSTTVKKNIAGTASSVAFTPLQGLEIVNPNAVEVKGDESSTAKYFSTSSTFMKVKTPAPI